MRCTKYKEKNSKKKKMKKERNKQKLKIKLGINYGEIMLWFINVILFKKKFIKNGKLRIS